MMKMRAFLPSLLIATTFILIITTGCKQTQQPQQPQSAKKVTLVQEWFPNSNYAGALFASKEFAKNHKLDIEIVPGSDQINAAQLVASGQYTFGDAGADKVLEAIDKGADLVIIGVVSYNSPTCFLAKESKNITTPKDFEGKTVGVLRGTNTEYVYRTLVKKMNLDTKKIKEVDAPFEITSFIASDPYDVRPAFIYDEPVTLDLQNIKYTVIEPKNYGVRFIGTVYFTKRSTIEQQPEIVQGFVESVADGWGAAIQYPGRAIEFLKQYSPSIDENRELLSLKKGLPYFEGKNKRILYAEQEDWEEMIRSLKELNVLSKEFDLLKLKILNNEFLLKHEALHSTPR